MWIKSSNPKNKMRINIGRCIGYKPDISTTTPTILFMFSDITNSSYEGGCYSDGLEWEYGNKESRNTELTFIDKLTEA